MTQLILVRGLPGSGKSTLAHALTNHPLGAHFEADMYFIDPDGVYRWDAGRIKLAHEWCLAQTAKALRERRMVAVSNTFTTVRELQPYFSLAVEHNITPTVITCNNRFPNLHGVPAETLRKMAARFEHNLSALFDCHEAALRGDNVSALEPLGEF